MITDGLPQVIRKVPSEVYLPYYRKWVRSKEEYCKRFAYIEALSHYREDVAPYLSSLRPDSSYYVTMAQAWMSATFAITHFQEVVVFLERDDLPLSLKRKTISKIVDSFRISVEQKEIVKKMRAKF
jgi:3-methyladenine DNA glycosylase AlkD